MEAMFYTVGLDITAKPGPVYRLLSHTWPPRQDDASESRVASHLLVPGALDLHLGSQNSNWRAVGRKARSAKDSGSFSGNSGGFKLGCTRGHPGTLSAEVSPGPAGWGRGSVFLCPLLKHKLSSSLNSSWGQDTTRFRGVGFNLFSSLESCSAGLCENEAPFGKGLPVQPLPVTRQAVLLPIVATSGS